MRGKRGITAGQIILMVLAVLVLAVLVYALTTGTIPFFGSVDSFGGGEVNVQREVQSCQISCSTGSVFDYCGKVRQVIFQKGTDKVRATCKGLESAGVGLEPCLNVNLDLCAAALGKALTKIEQANLREYGIAKTAADLEAEEAALKKLQESQDN